MPEGPAVLHPHHDHELVLSEDRVGLRFYRLVLGTNRLQRQGVGVPGWVLLMFTLLHHALWLL